MCIKLMLHCQQLAWNSSLHTKRQVYFKVRCPTPNSVSFWL